MSDPAPATSKETAAPVTFEINTKNLNVGDTSARLGFSLSITENEADFLAKVKLLCCARLQLKLVLTQDTLPGIEGAKPVEAVVESKNLGVSPKAITGGLVFSTNDIDPGNLAHFAKKECTITVQRIGLAAGDDDQD